jgi:alkaline phosphatase D
MDIRNPSIPDPTEQNRRQFLRRTSAASVAAVVGLSGQESTAMTEEGEFESNPFSLGVASGDPLPRSVVLWTRLAPDPLTVGGGMPEEPVAVDWTIAADESFEHVLDSGTAMADPEHAHTVHVEASGLHPDTEYHYRFEAKGARSPVGRTKTAPRPGSTPVPFEFGFVSCQNWPSGHYTAYRHMAEDELDLIIHLGDYIYEGGIGANGGVRDRPVPQAYRTEADSLERYRLQYGLYKSDEDLQAAHASAPWLITRDDHEVDNNWADEVPQDPGRQPTEEFLERRAAAFKAYYEHMPFRPPQQPMGPDQKLYRNYRFGDLLEFNVLDTRLYRSDQACGDEIFATGCQERFDDDLTILGEAQMEWLLENLRESDVTWDVLANQIKFSTVDRAPGPTEAFGTDQWEGYVADQNTVKRAFEAHVDNPVIVTGDIHLNMAIDIKGADEPSNTVGTEFVGTSISSGGDEGLIRDALSVAVDENENLKYLGNIRGYTRCTVTPEEWTTEYRVVDYVSDPGAPARTDAVFRTRVGQPGLQPRRPTVAVDSLAVRPGETDTAALAGRRLPAGLDGATVRCSPADPAVATIADVSVAEAFEDSELTVATDGSSATIEFADPNGRARPAGDDVGVGLGSLAVRGERTGRVRLNLTVEAGGDEGPVTSPGFVAVEGPSSVAGTDAPRDIDGDGRYEDVDGDGTFDDDDIETLFEELHSERVRENARAYDFDGDGDLDLGDLVELIRSSD